MIFKKSASVLQPLPPHPKTNTHTKKKQALLGSCFLRAGRLIIYLPTVRNPLTTEDRNQIKSMVNTLYFCIYSAKNRIHSYLTSPNKCKNRKLPSSTKVQKHKLEHDNFKTYNDISQCFYYENILVEQAP